MDLVTDRDRIYEVSNMMKKNYSTEDNPHSTNLSNFMHELSKTKKHRDYDTHDWITIDKLPYVTLILESYADSDKRCILEATIDRSRNISEIFDVCNKPQTSVYRKVMSLIECGLLVSDSFSFKHGRKSTKYKSIFEELRIDIIRNKISIKVKPTIR
jgi:hypothetical protein